jgi:hypothetical protein
MYCVRPSTGIHIHILRSRPEAEVLAGQLVGLGYATCSLPSISDAILFDVA